MDGCMDGRMEAKAANETLLVRIDPAEEYYS